MHPNISISGYEDDYYKGLKHFILAKAYQTTENHICTAENYKMALKYNSEMFEAFDKLIGNYLLKHEERQEFLAELRFNDANLWLKDYYRSRIAEDINPVNPEGKVVIS